jgi:hypothetical protein
MSFNPNDPLGVTQQYGLGTTPSFACLSGVDAVYDSLIARITTQYLWYDTTYGIDIDSYVNSCITSPQSALVPVLRQIKLDPRVSNVTGTTSYDGTTLSISLLITLTTGQTLTIVGNASTQPASAFQFSYVVGGVTSQS